MFVWLWVWFRVERWCVVCGGAVWEGGRGGGGERRGGVELFREIQWSPPRTVISRGDVSRITQYVMTIISRVSIISTDIIPGAINNQRVRREPQHTVDGQKTEG